MLEINAILAVTSDAQTCARCGSPIERGFAAGCTWDKHVILHVDCAVDVNAAATANAIRASKRSSGLATRCSRSPSRG